MSLTIINEWSSLTIVNVGQSLTIVNEGSSLTIVNETTNFIKQSFWKKIVLKTNVLKNDRFKNDHFWKTNFLKTFRFRFFVVVFITKRSFFWKMKTLTSLVAPLFVGSFGWGKIDAKICTATKSISELQGFEVYCVKAACWEYKSWSLV